MALRPLAPQASVSANSTTRARWGRASISSPDIAATVQLRSLILQNRACVRLRNDQQPDARPILENQATDHTIAATIAFDARDRKLPCGSCGCVVSRIANASSSGSI